MGDGETDHTSTLESLIKRHKNLYFPDGTYLCNLNLNKTETFNIIGNGPTTLLKSNNPSLPVINLNGVEKSIRYSSISNLKIDGNEGHGLQIVAGGANVVSKTIFQNLFIINSDIGIHVDGEISNVYKNTFEHIQLLGNVGGLYLQNTPYNRFIDIEIISKTEDNSAYSIKTDGGSSTFQDISCDAPIVNDGQNNSFMKVCIECMTPTPSSSIAFIDNGYNTILDLSIVNVESLKCQYGYVAENGPKTILGLQILGDTPSYPFSIGSNSSGVLMGFRCEGGFKATDYMSESSLKNWVVNSSDAFFDFE